jgi:hypothetical protein
MRHPLLTALAVAALAAPTAVEGQRLDPNRPEDAIRIGQKINCSTIDGKDALYWWHGNVYSRVPGERDRLLFKVQGFNVRACKSFNDPRRGPGYRSVSREMLVYFDRETGELLRRWKNPWTGEEVEVLFVANDPVNAREPSYAYDEDGNPPANLGEGMFEKDGVYLNGGGAARLFYDNPLGGEYQKYIGGTYHAMEFGTSASPPADLLDAKATHVSDRVISWVRVSKWLPWMKMGDRAGVVMFHTAGLRLDSWDEVPEVLRSEVKANWATFMTAPPTDDTRPNMTSWEQFKRWKAPATRP